MIQLQSDTRILLATHAVDFRNGIDGFVAICRLALLKDPLCGTYFVFINRSRTMIRVLVYDGSGFWLMTKRLSKGRFREWPTSTTDVNTMDAKRLRILLSGSGPASFNKISSVAAGES